MVYCFYIEDIDESVLLKQYAVRRMRPDKRLAAKRFGCLCRCAAPCTLLAYENVYATKTIERCPALSSIPFFCLEIRICQYSYHRISLHISTYNSYLFSYKCMRPYSRCVCTSTCSYICLRSICRINVSDSFRRPKGRPPWPLLSHQNVYAKKR